MDALIEAYDRFVHYPWERSVAGPERVWLAVYPPPDECRFRFKLEEFKIATQSALRAQANAQVTWGFARSLARGQFDAQRVLM